MSESKNNEKFKENFKIYIDHLKNNKLRTISKYIIYAFPVILIIKPVTEFFNSNIFCFFIILLIICIFHEYIEFEDIKKIAETESDLKESKKIIEKNHSAIEILGGYLSYIPKHYMKIMSDQLNLRNADRVSLYIFNDDNFQIIGRYSKNPSYKEIGRKIYPRNEGYISKCITNNNGKSYYYKGNLPKNKEKYLKTVSKDTNISRDVISNLSMKSRAYFCKLIQDYDKNNIGVLVIETINPSLKLKEIEVKNIDELDEKINNLFLPFLHIILDIGNKIL